MDLGIRGTEKPLLEYLRKNDIRKALSGNKFYEYTGKILEHILLYQSETNKITLEAFITSEHFFIIYVAMLLDYPNQCLDIDGPILLPTLVFCDTQRLRHFIKTMEQFKNKGFPKNKACEK